MLIEVVVINFFAKIKKIFPCFQKIKTDVLLSLLSSNGEGCWFGFASSGGMHREENLKHQTSAFNFSLIKSTFISLKTINPTTKMR